MQSGPTRTSATPSTTDFYFRKGTSGISHRRATPSSGLCTELLAVIEDMGRYREYMTGSKLRDPSTSSSRDRKASPSQVSSSSSSDPNFMSFRRRARMNARNQELRDQDRMMGSRNEHHKSRSIQHESYRSRSPVQSRRRRGRESSDESPAPKRRRRESIDDEERHERHYRRSSPSPMRRGDRKDKHGRGRQRNPDHRSASPPTRRRESSQHRKLSPSSREPSRSPSPRHRHRESRSHRHPHAQSQHKRNRSHSPRHRRPRSPPRGAAPAKRSHAPLPSQDDAFALKSGSYRPARSSNPSSSQLTKPPSPPPPKQAPNYAPTGLLAAETNTVANTSIVLKYHEPPNARLPPSSDQWRLFIFKGDSHLSTLNLYERTCWLFGRERLIADCATDHPSCSKQHAVIQFRYTQVDNEEGQSVGAVRPYLIDLESANGTLLNKEAIPQKRYVELKTEDVVTFGSSEREYVVLLPPRK